MYKNVYLIGLRAGVLDMDGNIRRHFCVCGTGAKSGPNPDCPVDRFRMANGLYQNEVVIGLVSAMGAGLQPPLTAEERFQMECAHHMITSEKYTQVLELLVPLARFMPELVERDAALREPVSSLMTMLVENGLEVLNERVA